MSEQVGYSKRSRVVQDLAARIRSGRLARGERLPGENQLAQRYSVSRGTVRSALAELQSRELIATETGVGSFVTFDGVALDQGVGWARALADSGADVVTELLGIEAGEELPGFGPVVTVRRLRRCGGIPVSVETSALPANAELADLPRRGLVDGSITETLLAAGLHGTRGEQCISVQMLGPADAALLARTPGEPFLHAERTTLTADGALVEHVVSLLDPARFSFHLTFGAGR